MSGLTQQRMVIHIGYPKCASTYLQKTVFPRLGNFANFGNLSGAKVSFEERTYLYRRDMEPKCYREMIDRHTVLADALKTYRILSAESYVELPFSGFERNFGQIARQKGIDLAPYDHRNEVICENLFRTWPEAYILIVIREPFSWAVSRYDHWYRRDLVDRPLDVCLDELGEGYDKLIERYTERFGPEHVRVVPYEWLAGEPERFLRAVTEFIDPSFDQEIPNVRTNAVPPSAAEVEYRRAQYRLNHRNEISNARRRIGQVLLPLLRPVYRLKHGDQTSRSVVPEETRLRLRPQLQASHRHLEELTGLNLKELGY